MKAWPINVLPTTRPRSSLTRLPLAWLAKPAWAKPVINAGYNSPVTTTVVSVTRMDVHNVRNMLPPTQTRPSAKSARSITLMPTNGATTPPTP